MSSNIMSSSNMEKDKSSPQTNQTNWKRFKRWCYVYHRELAMGMLVILIIIGIWFNPFEEMKNELGHNIEEQTGGRFGLAGISTALSSSGKVARKSGVSPDIKSLSELKNMGSNAQASYGKEKYKALIGEGGKGLKGTVGAASDYAISRFRENSSLIYEILYQIAFVIIILLIVFPTAALFIIAIICFIVLRDKLAYMKSL